MLKVAALRNDFTYGKLFHQLEEIVSELLRYLWEIPSSFGRAPKFVSFFAFGQTVLLLIYSLSSVQWCPLLQKFRTGSHNQHLPRTATDKYDKQLSFRGLFDKHVLPSLSWLEGSLHGAAVKLLEGSCDEIEVESIGDKFVEYFAIGISRIIFHIKPFEEQRISPR